MKEGVKTFIGASLFILQILAWSAVASVVVLGPMKLLGCSPSGCPEMVIPDTDFVEVAEFAPASRRAGQVVEPSPIKVLLCDGPEPRVVELIVPRGTWVVYKDTENGK